MTNIQFIQTQVNTTPKNIEATIKLLDEDCTVPFISRYRKDQTGNLDEVQIENIAKQQMGDLLKGISLFDIYRDKKIGEDKKSYAISLTLQDEGKTLTDDKLEKMMSKLIQQLETQLQAEIRKA